MRAKWLSEFVYVFRWLTPVFLALSLVACGFQPRGSLSQLTDMGSIFIDAERNMGITDSVKDALVDASFTIAANRDDASITLRLVDEQQRERVVSVRSTGRISELELSHSVSMSIQNSSTPADGLPENTPVFNRVEVFREYTYDETGVLGKENEARILRVEMEEELVRQIVLRTIASLAPSVTTSSVYQAFGYTAALHDLNAAGHL